MNHLGGIIFIETYIFLVKTQIITFLKRFIYFGTHILGKAWESAIFMLSSK